jgi:hypothetical protein
MGNRIPPAEESVDDSAQDDEDDEEGEDYDDPNGGHSPDRYWGTDYRAQNEVEEGDDKQKKFADYIYNEYLKDAKQPMTAMRLSQEIMNDTDSRINPVYIKAAIKAHYPEIELK